MSYGGRRRTAGQLGVNGSPPLLRVGGDAVQTAHVLGGRHPTLDRVQHLTLRGHDDRGRQPRDAILLGSGREMVGVDLHQYVVGRQFGGERRLAEDLSFEAFTVGACRSGELDQDQSVRLASDALCIFERYFPADWLLRQTRRR